MFVPSLPLLSCESSTIMKRNLGRKKNAENLDFIERSNFIRGSTEAGFCACSGVNSQENTRSLFCKVIQRKPIT